MLNARSTALLFTSVLASACMDHDPEMDLDDELAFRTSGTCIHCGGGSRDDGAILNTQLLKGLPICNSMELNAHGDFRDYCALTGVTKRSETGQNLEILDIYLDGGILHGVDASGTMYAGPDFVGTQWHILLDEEGFHSDTPTQEPVNPTPWVMEIDSFTDDGHRSRYVFLNGPSTQQLEEHNCMLGDPADNDFTAILYPGLTINPEGTHETTESTTMYFGCTSGAVGKAGLWGYGPGETNPDVFQTATRMVRADYCGTGVSYTVTGTPIQLEDVFGKNSFGDASEATEALWGPNGATCLDTTRIASAQVACSLPVCDEATYENQGATIWTKDAASLAP